jgi:hypothetical protein
MNMKKAMKRTMVAVVVAIAVAGSLAGAMVASAKASHEVKPALEKIAATDTDTVQSGDQRSPDTAAKPSEASGAPSNETEGEAGASSDGSGGWQDPAGVDVNNEQSGSH